MEGAESQIFARDKQTGPAVFLSPNPSLPTTGDGSLNGDADKPDLVVVDLHAKLIDKVRNGEAVCGPDGRCIVYGMTIVTRVTDKSREVWHDLPSDSWSDVWPIPGSKEIRKPSLSVQTNVQTGHIENGYEVGVEYYQSVVVDGVVASPSIIETNWTGDIAWQDSGIEIQKRRWRICAPGGVSCVGGQ